MSENTKRTDILIYLQEIGCCKNCCLRYLCDKSLDFSEIDTYLEKNDLSKYFETNGIDAETEESKCKKIKTNPCTVCLGLLQDVSLKSILANSQLDEVKNYDTKVFTCSISFPACVLIREHSMRLNLENKFPEFFNEDNQEIPLNRVWKMFVKKPLEIHLNKIFENSDICVFSINIIMEYEDDAIELEVLKEMQPKMFEERKLQHRKFNGGLFSRKGALVALSRTTSGIFNMYAKVPPEIPTNYLLCKSIECKHDSIFIAGRYCKYSRELSQTPWIIDGVKTMETSLQEIIFQEVATCFKIPYENLVFSSSGREDCDVRCVGRGRPFYIEILNPKRTQYIFNDFRLLEKDINKSEMLGVKDLQLVKRGDLTKIKEGEETKTKTYTALCVLKCLVSQEIIDKINNVGCVKIQQKTPMRVLHRRPVAVREKIIHEMKAEFVENHPKHFKLHLKTQAGTYVKEFVHGDFMRTKPSIGEIINAEVDIIALDVTGIDLDWPASVQYENNSD